MMVAERFDDCFGKLAVSGQSVEPFDRRLDRASTSAVLFLPLRLPLASACLDQTKRPRHPRQRQAFADQGHDNDAESQKQDQIAIRKGSSVGDRIGNRERRDQGDDAADPVNANANGHCQGGDGSLRRMAGMSQRGR